MMTEPGRCEAEPSRTSTERWLLGVLAGFTMLAVLGFATFGQHPSLLTHLPQWGVNFYATAFRLFAVGQVWLAMGVFVTVLVLRTGIRWLPAFAVLYAISLGAEMLGTTRGVPFGEYSYSPLLDPMWAGHVPVVIPLSWFYMAVPAYAVAMLALAGPGRTLARIALASMVLLIWDLALDPAMSYATSYWRWEGAGPYYGMPWMNLFGWYVTGLALMIALHFLHAERWITLLRFRWLMGFYVLNLAMPMGMNVAAGLWLAIAVTIIAAAATGVLAYGLASRPPRLEVRRGLGNQATGRSRVVG